MKRYLALKASAGSGKTFALVVRYISLLLSGANISQILAITFTIKAAQQMRENIVNVLTNLDKDEYKAYLVEISKSTKYTNKQIIEQKSVALKQFSSFEPNIMTIDKFLNKILRLFCWYVGMNQNFNIKNENPFLIKQKFLESLDYLELNRLTKFLANTNTSFSTIWTIFEILDDKSCEIEIKLNDQYIDLQEDIILDTAFEIKKFVDNSDASLSAKNSVDFDSLDTMLIKGKTWLAKESLQDFSYFKKIYTEQLDIVFFKLKLLLSQYFRKKEQIFLFTIYKYFKNYQSVKKNYIKLSNNLSFGDVSNFVFELLQTRVDNEFLYFRLDNRISHILIDEFQDTSILQFYIFKPMIDEIVSQSGRKSFFYVGDPKQSIYRFRGGHSGLFNYVIGKYKDSITLEHLNTNYRSSSNIVTFINEIFNNKIEDYKFQIPSNKNNKGYIEINSSEKILEDLSDTILMLSKHNISYHKIAILTFENRDSLLVKEFLNIEFPHIPTFTQTTSKLIDRQNIAIIVNIIKYIYFKEEIYKLYAVEMLDVEDLTNDTKKLTIDTPLCEIIIFLIDEYSLYDDNILKFLEEVYLYDDIYEFIFQIDQMNTQIVSESHLGIEIMTIHKSKGLEFDHIILIDRLSRKKSSTNNIIYQYDDMHIKKIFYKFSLREYMDDEYKDALKQESHKNDIDKINLLYVALTRAKESLIIIQKDKNSEFSILELPICNIGKIDKQEITKNIDVFEPSTILQIEYYGKQNNFILKQKAQEKQKNLNDINFGLAVHFAFENLKDFQIDSLDDSIDITLNKFGSYLNNINSIKKILLNTITDKKFIELTSGKIFKELELYIENKKFVVDVLIEFDEYVCVIDFKTSSSSSSHSYYEQIDGYKKLVSLKFGKKAKGYLCFVSSKKPNIIEV